MMGLEGDDNDQTPPLNSTSVLWSKVTLFNSPLKLRRRPETEEKPSTSANDGTFPALEMLTFWNSKRELSRGPVLKLTAASSEEAIVANFNRTLVSVAFCTCPWILNTGSSIDAGVNIVSRLAM